MLSADFVYGLRPFLLPLLLPPTPPLLLALVGAWLTWQRRRVGALALVLGVALGWLSCSERVGALLVDHLLHPPPPLTLAEIDRLASKRATGQITAVLVLGGGAVDRSPEYGASDLNETSIARLRYGVWLARRIGAPLGFSGGVARGSATTRPPEAEIARRVATEEFGMPLRWVEGRSRDTGENASYSVQALKLDKVQCAIVVTHRDHLPRALRAFHQAVAGDSIEIIPAGLGNRVADAPFVWGDWIPSAHGLRQSRSAVTEWLGWVAGR